MSESRILRALEKEVDKLNKRIKELEKTLDKIRLISGASYKLPVTSVAAMKNLRTINMRCEQTLEG